MKALYIFYDERCGICSRFREWMQKQDQIVEARFVSYHSPEARQVCPQLDTLNPDERLVAMDDTGQTYQGEIAWVKCLYSLRKYRDLSLVLARPRWLPLAHRVCNFVSSNRYSISRLLFGRQPEKLLKKLEGETETETCRDGVCPL